MKPSFDGAEMSMSTGTADIPATAITPILLATAKRQTKNILRMTIGGTTVPPKFFQKM
jgi:hypothetical protein